MNRRSLWIGMAVAAVLFITAGLPALAEPESPQIVGGEEAVPGAWPWQVALIDSAALNNYDGQYCGGALIDSWWVLTAAHCVEDLAAGDIDIVLGAHNLLEPEPNAQRIAANDLFMHPDYNSYTSDSDIALIQLAEAAVLTDGAGGGLPVKTAALVGADVGSLEGTMSTAIGWGNRSAQPYPGNFDYPETLHQVELPIVSNQACNDAFEAQYLPPDVTDNMMCAGFLHKGGRDSCYGDSGGPLMIQDSESETWQVAGLVSWGYGCANPGLPGVSTRVSKFVPWINEILERQKVNLVKTVSAEAATPGDVLDYTLSLLNFSSEPIDDLELVDPLPEGTTLVPGSISSGGSLTDGVIRWPVSSLAAGATFTGEFSLEVNDDYLESSTFFADDLEGDLDAWSVAHNPGFGDSDWRISETWSHSASNAWFAPDVDMAADQYLILQLPDTLPPMMELNFWHSFDIEEGFDGGVVEISIDGGTTWNDLGQLMVDNGYNYSLFEDTPNPLSGREAFSGYTSGWVQTSVDLQSFAGESVQIRFRLGTDSDFGFVGWAVDDILVDRKTTINNQAHAGDVKSNTTITAVVDWIATHFIFIPIVDPPDEDYEPPGGYP